MQCIMAIEPFLPWFARPLIILLFSFNTDPLPPHILEWLQHYKELFTEKQTLMQQTGDPSGGLLRGEACSNWH